MRTSTSSLWLTPILVSTAAALSLAGCALAGVRASSDGACPAGETCSSDTPEGLLFSGSAFSDGLLGAEVSGVATVAVGGKETVTASANIGSAAFTEGFTVTSADPGAITIGAVSPPSFQMFGSATGTSLVQLLALDGSGLLDEVDLDADTIESVTLFPPELLVSELFEEDTEDAGAPPPDLSVALLAGSTTPVPLVIRLHGTKGGRLADETTTVTSAQGTGPQTAWDLFTVTPPASKGLLSFSVQAGGGTFSTILPVVDTIGSITVFPEPTQDASIAIGTAGSAMCFMAMSGGASVAGAAWTFSPSANVAVKPFLSNSPGCVTLTGTAPGPATLAVTASGFSQTFPLTVASDAADGARSIPHASRRGALQPVMGHRAAWLGGR